MNDTSTTTESMKMEMADFISSVQSQSKIILSGAQMQEMITLISKGNVDGPHFEAIMVQLWKMVAGDDCFNDDKPNINCTAYAIPKWQSEKLLERMLVAAGPHGTGVGLNYINIAPSTFDE